MGHSTSKSTTTKNTHIVVIGGSYAGRAAARLLEKEATVTCIERREVLVHKMLVRSAVCDEWIEPALVSSSHMLSTGKLLHADVSGVNLEDRSITCRTSEGGEQVINYDYLIIASGAQSRSPMEPAFRKLEDGSHSAMKAHYSSSAGTIAKHKNILIVGGGPVGCELAGEIKAKHPDARVIIASSTDRLCDKLRTTHEGSDKIQKGLEKHGITVKLGVEVPVDLDKFKDGFLEFSEPQSFADGSISGVTLMILAIGSKPNTQFLPQGLLTDRGEVKVNEFLQVNERVYAIGDCNDVKEPKLFVTAGTKKFMPLFFPTGQADIAARNILAAETGKPLSPYVPLALEKKQVVTIPLGPKDAVAVNAPKFFAKLKAKDYFYPAQWKYNRETPPKVHK